jgi:hypothetical protein
MVRRDRGCREDSAGDQLEVSHEAVGGKEAVEAGTRSAVMDEVRPSDSRRRVKSAPNVLQAIGMHQVPQLLPAGKARGLGASGGLPARCIPDVILAQNSVEVADEKHRPAVHRKEGGKVLRVEGRTLLLTSRSVDPNEANMLVEELKINA